MAILPVRKRVLVTVAKLIQHMGRGRRTAARRQEPDPGTSSSVESSLAFRLL